MKSPLIIFLLFLSFSGKSQSVSLATGFGLDANNSGKSLALVPLEVRWHPLPDIPLALTINYDKGLSLQKNADAFTLNPDLPEKVILKERYNADIFTFGLTIDINLFHTKPSDDFIFSVMPLAYSFHHIRVSYKNFDKENYTILNEDVSGSPSGLVSAFGIRYLFKKDKFIALNIQTPLLRKSSRDLNFRYTAPARLMFGYQFQYKKSK